MVQLVASVSGVVLGGVAKVVGSNLAKGKIFTYVWIYKYIYVGHEYCVDGGFSKSLSKYSSKK